jgi:hypothetical protein
VLAVAVVAAIAAVVSYTHLYDLGITHGQTGIAARLLPLSVDGLVVVASLVLLQSARNGCQSSGLPRFALWLGIGATVAANLAYGLPYGPVGAVLSAWPGAAFVLAVEILLGSLRQAPEPESLSSPSRAPEEVQKTVHASPPPARTRAHRPLPANRPTSRGVSPSPAEVFAQELAAGKLPGIRTVKARMSCGQERAKEIKGDLAVFLSDRPATIESMS